MFTDALKDAEVIGAAAAVRAFLGREPTRAEITAARRAAGSYARSGQATTFYVSSGRARVLMLARPDADVERQGLRDVAAWRKHQPRRGAPRSDQRVLATLTTHVVAAGRAARLIDIAKVSPANAAGFADDLDDAMKELARLRARLRRRAQHGREAGAE
ncbi:MAG TPA: hypothetical protein VFP34_02040 [Microlunatus sp.]|nr:hypothetical protein [Microlunatus sp.]